MELDGISNACTMKVMMNRPVTSTAASDARNSTVVSRGFSGLGFILLATGYVRILVLLVDEPKGSIPPRDLKQMGHRVCEMKKFITGAGSARRLLSRVFERPVNHPRGADDVFPGNEPPIAAVEALIPIISQGKIGAFRNNQLPILDELMHLYPPFTGHIRNRSG